MILLLIREWIRPVYAGIWKIFVVFWLCVIIYRIYSWLVLKELIYHFRHWPFKHQPHKMVKHTQTIRQLLPTDCMSVFDQFVGLALKGLTLTIKNIKPGYDKFSTGKKLEHSSFWMKLNSSSTCWKRLSKKILITNKNHFKNVHLNS